MVRCVNFGWVGVRSVVIRRGRYGELSWVQLGYVLVRWGMAGAVGCVGVW